MERDIPHQIVEDLERSSSSPPRGSIPRVTTSRERCLPALRESRASLPCRFFYDARGSALFEEITQLEEYYPTRMETALLEAYGAEIAERMGDASVLVEFGSGSSRKTEPAAERAWPCHAYVPIDVAGESLAEAAEWLSERHTGLAIRPLIADFTKTRTLPVAARRPRKLGFFSGSTIGNLTPSRGASAFLANAARLLGRLPRFSSASI